MKHRLVNFKEWLTGSQMMTTVYERSYCLDGKVHLSRIEYDGPQVEKARRFRGSWRSTPCDGKTCQHFSDEGEKRNERISDLREKSIFSFDDEHVPPEFAGIEKFFA